MNQPTIKNCETCGQPGNEGLILTQSGWICPKCHMVSTFTISKSRIKKLAARQAEKYRKELLIEKAEQLLDELAVNRIMESGKETNE